MNLLSIGKRSLGTIATGRGIHTLGSIPLVSNPLFLKENNTLLCKYNPQKTNTSIGKYEDIENKEDEDANKLVEIIGNILTAVDNLADGAIDSVKKKIPYIDDFAKGNLKYPDMLNKLRKDTNYKNKDSLKFIEDKSRLLNKYKAVSSVATVLGYIFAVDAGVKAIEDNPDDNWIEKGIRFAYEPLKVWISSAVAAEVVVATVGAEIVAAPGTFGASLVPILASGAVATSTYLSTFYTLNSFDPVEVIENPAKGISEGLDKAFVEPVVNSEIYQSIEEKGVRIMLDIEEELRMRLRIPDGLLQPGWSY